MVMIFRKAVSPIVATVLLLVLTVVIGGIVFSVVLPFVNDSLEGSKECVDAFEGVEFPESKFNCYFNDEESGITETGFSVKLNKEKIPGFRVALIDNQGNSEVFEIKSTTQTLPLLRMAGDAPATYETQLTFPSVGGQRTYVASGIYERAEISALTESGETCSLADTVEFEPCYPEVIL